VATRKNKKWPGLKAAAQQLGVNYDHLRRVVSGKVKSPALLERYLKQFGNAGERLQLIPSSVITTKPKD
jgi:hypothetical protein